MSTRENTFLERQPDFAPKTAPKSIWNRWILCGIISTYVELVCVQLLAGEQNLYTGS